MKTFHKEEFSFQDNDSAAVYEGFEFDRCTFLGCVISLTVEPALRSTVRNVRLTNCSQRGCLIYPAVIEESEVNGLNTHGQLLAVHGAVFKHVVLRGKIDRVMIRQKLGEPKNVQTAFDRANASYYRSVDWALDIRDGEFKELEIDGVPAKLIRRDPETQIVVKRKSVLDAMWKKLPLKLTIWHQYFGALLAGDYEDTVIVAGKRDPEFKTLIADLKVLRGAGVAEPD